MTEIEQTLKDLNINFILHKHPPVFTCEEAEKYRGDLKGKDSKNLFLRNRKGKKHYLVVLSSKKTLDLKGLANRLNESNLGFASEERLHKYLGCSKGSVSLFGIINDQNKVTFIDI